MADRYWVGGTGTWNTSTTNWSATSGGAGGASTPGSGDNVFFDANSGTGTITLGQARSIANFDCTGYSGTFTGTLALTIYGTIFKLAAGMTYSMTGVVNFYNTTPSATVAITTAGKTLGSVSFGLSGGTTTTFSLQDALLTTGTITVDYGTFSTNNFNVSASVLSSSNSNTRTINLGSSTVTLTGTTPINFTTSTNLAFNAGTSTITLSSGSGPDFAGGGKTYYNVVFSSVSVTQVHSITGANTFNNLTLATPSNSSNNPIYTFDSNQIINGTLTANGSSGNRRIQIRTATYGTQQTITAASVSLIDVDFYGILGAGTASWSGTRIGDATLNSGITFDSPKTVYWNLAAGGAWRNATAWATSSGGTPDTTNFPLPQDTAVIENTGLNASATITTTNQQLLLSNIDFSTRTNAMTFSWNSVASVCGNITYGSGVTNSGATAALFFGDTTLTSAGKTWTTPITVVVGATLTNADALTSSSTLANNGTLTLGANATFTTASVPSGTLNLNSYSLTSTTFTASNVGTVPTLNFGTGKIVVTGSGTIVFSGVANQVVTGTPVVEATYSGGTGTRTITNGGTSESSSVSIKVTAGTDTVSLLQGLRDVDFTGFSGTLSNNSPRIYGNLTISSGMTLAAGTSAIIFAATSGTKTITTNGKTLDFPITFNGDGGTWQLADNLLQGSTRTTTLTNGILDLNGKTFTVGTFATGSGTKNLTFNGGTLTIPAVTTTAFNNAQPTNFTTTAGTGTGKISMTGATAKTFVGGGSTYNCTLEQAGAGALTITGSNTFTTISNSVQPTSFLFTAGTTTTVTNFNVSGTSGNLVTIDSVTAANHTLSKSTGEVSVSYCTISRSTATGGATWKAYTSNGNVNGGNNSGWLFSASSGNGLLFGSNF